ncbi:MAG TPA: NAD-binding protein [Candidatus Baltobacteraceae bacterium]|jgi:voltage-gated potassium channel Kch
MVQQPLILVVGGDKLALRVTEELCATAGHRVALMWHHDPEIAAYVEKLGAEFLGFPPNDFDSLHAAGVDDAASIMALSDDDRMNLQVALKARDINPKIRVVLRQFNRQLGRKIAQNLPDCSVVSLSGHAAATFAACAVDRSVFYAVQFPDLDGPLVAFARRPASVFGEINTQTIAELEAQHKIRVVGYNGMDFFVPGIIPRPEDEVVLFGDVATLEALVPKRQVVIERRPWREVLSEVPGLLKTFFRRLDPIIKLVAVIATGLFVAFSTFFNFVYHKDPVTAIYFVLTTMTTTGYGDITPIDKGPFPMLMANGLMIVGTILTGIFIAFMAEGFSRAQYVATQGLRMLKHKDHIVVVGTGQVGTRVIDYLVELRKKVVVIDPSPDTTIVDRVRNRDFTLLTGDATREEVLLMCNLMEAQSVVALTGNETANLEVALGARARNPDLPVIMRVQDETFARLVEHQFSLDHSFSTSELSAPGFAGLSRFPGTRGRIAYGDETYNVGERQQGEIPQPPPAQDCIPLCVWRESGLVLINDFGQMKPFDRLLFLVPLSQFKAKPPVPKTEPEEAAEMETAATG